MAGCWRYGRRMTNCTAALSALCLLTTVLLVIRSVCLLSAPASATVRRLARTSERVLGDVTAEVNTSEQAQIHTARARHVQEVCAADKSGLPGLSSFSWALGRMELDDGHRYVFCPVLKASSTFFSRLFYPLYKGHSINNPYHVPIGKALAAKPNTLKRILPLHSKGSKSLPTNITTIMFVREPFARLLSGYVDKLLAPNPYFWTHVGKHIIANFRANAAVHSLHCGHDVHFSEFVDYVIEGELSNDTHRDAHFTPIYDTCKPCQLNYSIIGKLETFPGDVSYTLAKLGQPISPAQVESWSSQATTDAISDSTLSPFSWRLNIRTCMSWSQALIRIWRKLQIRGIILFQHKFPWSPREAERLVSAQTFIRAVQTFHAMADGDQLTAQRLEVLAEAYSSVPADRLLKLVDIFQPDFQLFDYNDHPQFIFNHSFVEPLRRRNIIFNLSDV